MATTYTFSVVDNMVEMTRFEDGLAVEIRELQKGVFNVMSATSSPSDDVVITRLNDDRESGYDIKVPYDEVTTPSGAANPIELIQLLRPLFAPIAGGGGGGGDASAAKQDEQTAELIDIKNAVARGKFERLSKEADDLLTTYTYLDQGTINERIKTIVLSSVTLGLTATKTFTYTASAPYSIVTKSYS